MVTSTKSRGCGAKHQHTSRQAAERQMESLIDAGEYAGNLNVYRCRHCRTWHVGHRPGNQRKH